RPTDDQRFHEKWRFSWRKWDRWLKRNGYPGYLSPNSGQFTEVRKVKTRLGGWRWSSFTKTQYASDPACGGIPNFLRCHISVVTLLEDRKSVVEGTRLRRGGRR